MIVIITLSMLVTAFGSHVLLWATGVVVVNLLPCTSLTKGLGRGWLFQYFTFLCYASVLVLFSPGFNVMILATINHDCDSGGDFAVKVDIIMGLGRL